MPAVKKPKPAAAEQPAVIVESPKEVLAEPVKKPVPEKKKNQASLFDF